jgi:deoxycytidylate deaminase
MDQQHRHLVARQALMWFELREGISLKDTEILVTLMPCDCCSKMLVAAKPKAVYYMRDSDSDKAERQRQIVKFFEDSGVPLVKV